MDILFVATELAPYARVGGLADFIAALSKTLRHLGHNVTLALPRFPHFEKAGLLVARRLTPLPFQLGDDSFEATVYDGRLPSGVDITLLDVPGMFDRDGIYGTPGEDYEDNATRFAVFSRAVVELLRHRMRAGTPFQVAHLHDWPASLTALYGKRVGDQELEECTKFVLTLHNLARQGVVDASMLARLGIGEDLFHPDGVEFYGKINILKAGITFADAVTTVSETYAREITTGNQGRGLEGVLSANRAKLTGIVNGIDYGVWNPATDPNLPSRFDAQDASNKARCKTDLIQELGLEMRNERPLAAFVGRLVEQKGIDLLLDALPQLMRSDMGLIIAGQGAPEIVARVEEAARKWKGDVAFAQDPTDATTHRILAGADIVIVPSRFEPCGVVQRYGQRYGTVPVVHATGGLIDTVVDCDAYLETGTGFVFDEESPRGVVGGVQRAVAAFSALPWARLRKRVMNLDLGWDRSAHRYVQIYKSLHR
jgi:starch synthase